MGGEGVPGVAAVGGYQECAIPGTKLALDLPWGSNKIVNRFIRPFDCKSINNSSNKPQVQRLLIDQIQDQIQDQSQTPPDWS